MSFSKEFKLALYSLDGIGVKRYHQILKTLTKAEISETEFWVNKAQIWQKLPINKKTEESIYKFKKEHTIYSFYEQIQTKNIRVVFTTGVEYPPLLKQLEFAPPLLFVKGAKLNLDQALSVVGTRKITAYGKQVLEWLIPDLAQAFPIVSGFMYGVDVYAQQLALDHQGSTVGVLGFGFDHIYPSSHQKLLTEFLANGASFISPFAPHVFPKPGNFPARNNLVAAISLGLCVIEAAKNSGSLLTAAMAVELGREVWAVPGSIFSPFSEGVVELLKQGANLVREPNDILSILGRAKQRLKPSLLENFQLSEQEKNVLGLLQAKTITIDDLLVQTKLPLVELQRLLLVLQLKNLVEEAGIYWSARL